MLAKALKFVDYNVGACANTRYKDNNALTARTISLIISSRDRPGQNDILSPNNFGSKIRKVELYCSPTHIRLKIRITTKMFCIIPSDSTADNVYLLQTFWTGKTDK